MKHTRAELALNEQHTDGPDQALGRSTARPRRLAGFGLLTAGLALSVTGGCGGGGEPSVLQTASAESCMVCHNASSENNYSGPGIENPHPFGDADNLLCSTCHGGDPGADDKDLAHVPPPPEIGDDDNLISNKNAYFNRLTLTGIDKFEDYEVGGRSYTALDYLQFINPGDLRVTESGRSCGSCHAPHSEIVADSMLATASGMLSGATFAVGAENAVPENIGLFEDTAADLSFRPATANPHAGIVGSIGRTLEFPVVSAFGANELTSLFNNDLYDAALLNDDILPNGQVISDSPLANLFREQVAFTCGDCHLGSAGANNRAGDFRSSGCTACHMPYSLGGRSGSLDPNVNKVEPLDPDEIEAPERAHVRAHRIVSVHKTLPGGQTIEGIDDHTCAGCHQGSNRTVMQYWGIRLDQNEDVRRNRQYPANPVSYVTTKNDERLFDPEVGNKTFNGRDHRQYLLFEDYDGDGRDDTPMDVHAEAGMGCIDCHGSHDLHGGVPGQGSQILSRMEQGVAVRCESCHGSVESYAATVAGTTYDGTAAQLAVDAEGNPMRHVVREPDGSFWLTSKLTGARHYVSQTRDVTVDTGVNHPDSGQPMFSPKASFAMGRDDGDAATGIGPNQGGAGSDFCHSDSMDCAACHSAWTNTCMGCHLEGEYNTNQANASNITGERIVFRERNADFVYQSPVPFQLGVGPRGVIQSFSSNTKTFFQWRDRQGDFSDTFTFSDRNGAGVDPSKAFASMSHNALMAHSIRGRVTNENEGPRYCVACHLTDDAIADFGAEYDTFRNALSARNYAGIDFNLLQQHIGQNPGNQLNSPFWVHMIAGLGSGLFLFDEEGCPVNPLDDDSNRKGCDGVAPADSFDLARVEYDLDRIVESNGQANGSNNHAFTTPGSGSALRDGALDPGMAGPLGASLILRLTDPTAGIVLSNWLNADGVSEGGAAALLGK